MRLTEHLRRYGLRHFDSDEYWEWASEKLGKKRSATVDRLRAPFVDGGGTPVERLRFEDYTADIGVGGPVGSQQTDDLAQATYAATNAIAGCARVLDLGCSVGHATTWFALTGDADRYVLGVDVSQRSIDVARTMAHRMDIPNVQFVTMDIDDQLPDGPFDAVIDMAAVQYTECVGTVVGRVKEALTDEGVFVSIPMLGTAPEIRAYMCSVELSGLRLDAFSWVYARDLGRNVARPIMTWRSSGPGITVDLLAELRSVRERLSAGRITPLHEVEQNRSVAETD